METSRGSLTDAIKREARRLGFHSVGVCPAVTPPGIARFRQWLERGYAGEMQYISDRAEAYEHPRHVMDGVRSLVMLTISYHTARPQPARPGEGRISRYAWGSTDYHDVIHAKLKDLASELKQRAEGSRVRGVVDTAPLLEREFAQLAGLGWIGKNIAKCIIYILTNSNTHWNRGS